jgi:gluconolactonase
LIHVFDVEGGGRQLTGRRDFYRVNNGNADGIRIDVEGNVWSSAGNGIHCIAPDGTLLGRIITPNLVGNLCFGGIHGNRLFLCSWDSMYSIYVNTRGIQHTAMS